MHFIDFSLTKILKENVHQSHLYKTLAIAPTKWSPRFSPDPGFTLTRPVEEIMVRNACPVIHLLSNSSLYLHTSL